MKRIYTLLFIAAGSLLKLNAQLVLSEDFNPPFTLNASTGWTVQNNSAPLGSLGWFQGNNTVFSAFNGASNAYYAANFNSTGTVSVGQADISNFLISPSVTIYNGAVFQFATRTTNSGTATPIPDRLQLLMSTTNTNAVPAGVNSVGAFNITLLDINPNLTSNTASVVSNGSVNGYPQSWTVYSVQISGVTGTVTGRFAFRYFVTNGGAGGANSDYIGVDGVRYWLPCGATVNSYTVCSGLSATLNATGGPSTTYSWSTGSTNSSVIVTPTATTIYSLEVFNGTVSCGNPVTSTVTIGSQLSFNINASSQTVCPGTSVTLTAISAATSFSWNTGGTANVVVVNPTTTTTYSVGGLNGFCFGGNTITINTFPSPTLNVAYTPSAACPGGTMSVNATGAVSYLWVLGSSSATGSLVSINTSTNPAGGTFSLGLIGTGSNGCSSSGIITLTISPNPTVTATVSSSVECVGRTVTLTASGANSYSWTGATSSNNNPLTYSTGTTPGTKTFSVSGENANGCLGSTSVSFSVSLCTGIEKINGNTLESHVFPNPFNTELQLSGFEGRIEIYNALGQVVISQKTSENEIISTRELHNGTYILKAYLNDGNVRTVKLMKN